MPPLMYSWPAAPSEGEWGRRPISALSTSLWFCTQRGSPPFSLSFVSHSRQPQVCVGLSHALGSCEMGPAAGETTDNNSPCIIFSQRPLPLRSATSTSLHPTSIILHHPHCSGQWPKAMVQELLILGGESSHWGSIARGRGSKRSGSSEIECARSLPGAMKVSVAQSIQ
ncbi:hypothetical protein JOB18_000607 [Solea senegalensis]|uniref:Uncharacterized protein n=1 Tax=Solea senegalensis TaxID=28829 RepID=A0AAV6S9H4_SOLSE|nr:hypothetical protein JOB18_000607 [Solea senegalensis]